MTFRLLDADFGAVYYGFGDWNGTAVPAAGCYPVYESNTPVIEYNGHYYTVFYEGLSWADAQSKCEELGGHLVSITTPQENAVIARLSGGDCWIGAECYDGAISWVTGEEAGFSNWAEDQPDNTDDEQHWVCQWSDGTWDDEFADSGYNYACEWDSAENCPWEAQEVWHVVTFDGNGAAGETAPQVAVAGEPLTLPSGDYEWPEGQKLHGWQIGDETYPAGDSIAVEEDITATAVWGDPGQLTSTVTVDAAENVATLTVSARNFVKRQTIREYGSPIEDFRLMTSDSSSSARQPPIALFHFSRNTCVYFGICILWTPSPTPYCLSTIPYSLFPAFKPLLSPPYHNYT